MGRKKKSADDGLLTPLELEVMTLLWRLGEGSVHDVMELFPKDKEYAYNTVSTVLRILQTKGVVEARKDGRTHTYVPLLAKDEFEEKTVHHVVERVFEGEPKSLVRCLVDSGSLSKDDLDELRALLARGGRK
ncbi:MAG: BlaI/MecI/CopY family transcriptional regulator [Bdellovibrionaceae bacterium]|nr:BlaI/MecI/CopY family transcriptional regulator [Pseudobdellovibrionaceae bacterium]